MKIHKSLLMCAILPAAASAAVVNVSQDGAINGQDDGSGYGSNNVVLNGGTANQFAAWMPGPPSAWQYTRKIFLGFDTTGINLSGVTQASMTINTASGSAGQPGTLGFNAYLVADAGGTDQFDETTLTWNLANTNGWNQNGNAVTSQQTPGQLIGNVLWAGNDSSMTFDFSAGAISALQTSANDFVTVVLVPDATTSGAYGGNDAAASTGPSFLSKESGSGATLNLIPEPSSAVLASLGVLGFLRRRR